MRRMLNGQWLAFEGFAAVHACRPAGWHATPARAIPDPGPESSSLVGGGSMERHAVEVPSRVPGRLTRAARRHPFAFTAWCVVLAWGLVAGLAGSAPSGPPGPPTPTPTKVAVVAVPGAEFRIVGASLARSHGAGTGLGPLPDGRGWLVVSVDIRNIGREDRGFDSDSFEVVADGKEINEAGDAVDGANEALGLRSMGDMIGTHLDGGAREVFALVYKVPLGADSYRLKLEYGGDRDADRHAGADAHA